MKKLLVATMLALSLSGCAALSAVVPVLSNVAAAFDDASNVLRTIDVYVQQFFATNPPPPEVRDKYAQLMGNAHSSLSVASKALKGVEGVEQEDYDKAFSTFRESYAELVQFLKTTGAMNAAGGLKGPGEETPIPEPMALTLKVGS